MHCERSKVDTAWDGHLKKAKESVEAKDHMAIKIQVRPEGNGNQIDRYRSWSRWRNLAAECDLEHLKDWRLVTVNIQMGIIEG